MEEMLNILLELKEGQKKLDSKIENIEQKVNNLEGKIDKLEERITSLEKRMDSLEEKINILDKRITSLEIRMNILEEKVNNIDRAVMTIETKHEDQIKILFDANSLVKELIEKQDVKIENQEKALDRHSDELYFLNSKIQ